jgi:hypothetical protein
MLKFRWETEFKENGDRGDTEGVGGKEIRGLTEKFRKWQ